ncbi:MAG TPA: cysteine desulfurase [Candidatus Marinimicrobia bacterium]|jgi:cysteine desulfurase|nr:cysteine desulfurase [Candidatus Neomarinimicrobiota bacterium]
MLYFDHSATTPIHPDVQSLINELNHDIYGNPSSIHVAGRKAKHVVETARKQIADAVNCAPKEIIFTGGGSEANNLVLWNMIHRDRKHVITSAIEHPAILAVLRQLEHLGITHTIIPVNKYGWVNPEDIDAAIRDDTGLITIMLANNEVGTVEPLQDIAKIAKKHDVLFHSDGIQVMGKLPIDVQELGMDMMSFSAHKFYGPKGVGALYIKEGISMKPLIIGGSQEKSLRAGTENVGGIAGLGCAAELVTKSLSDVGPSLTALEKQFKTKFSEQHANVIYNGFGDNHLAGLINITIPGIASDLLLIHLDSEDIAISSGSACSSGTISPSPVLKAMGISDKQNLETIRISAGRDNTSAEVDQLVETMTRAIATIRRNAR